MVWSGTWTCDIRVYAWSLCCHVASLGKPYTKRVPQILVSLSLSSLRSQFSTSIIDNSGL